MIRLLVPGFLFLLSVSSASAQASLCFSGVETKRYAVDTVPAGVVSADFNDDGKPDIAVVSTYTGKVQVLMNDGTGSFMLPIAYTVGTSPECISAADFTGDSIPDLAVTNYGSNTVSVLLNNGTGSFPTITTYSVGTNPMGITSADFNNDGVNDLACTNFGSFSISRLFNNGSGVFTVQPPISTPGGLPIAIVAGKFNADSYYDIAYSNDVSGMRVLMNNGTGGFPTSNSYGFSTPIRALATGDFNGDGKTDIAGNSSGSFVFIRYNNGTGSFGSGSSINIFNGGNGIASDDFNNDGYDDVVATNYMNTEAAILMSTGPGFYKLSGMATAGTSNGGTYGVAIADFDSDGHPDFVITNHSTRNILTFRNTSSGKFSIVTSYTISENPEGLAVADINGDGINDMMTGNGSGSALFLHTGTGGGAFAPVVVYTATGNNIRCITTGDFNGDGRTDCITANYGSGSISIFYNNNAGGFLPPVNFSVGSNPSYLCPGDFNNDGTIDLAIPAGGSLKIFSNNGNGTFTNANSYNVGGGLVYSIDTADFNSDGNCDLIVGKSNGTTVLTGSGTGTFTVFVGPPNSLQPRYVATGDFNNDGFDDYAAAIYNGSSVYIYLNTGIGTFTGPMYLPAGPNPVAIRACDVNGDQYDDLVFANCTDPSVTIMQNSTNWNTYPSHTYATGSFPSNICWDDLNQDGHPDVLVANAAGNSLSLLLNNTALVTAAGPTTVCNNETVLLTATAGGGNYVWTPGGSTNDSLLVTMSGSYSYSFVSSTGACSSTSASITVTINPNPYPSATLTAADDTLCLNHSPTLLTGTPAGGIYSGGGVTGNGFTPSAAGVGTHLITYLYTDSIGCSDTTTIPILVNPVPALVVNATSPSICAGQIDTLNVSGAQSYLWDFGGINSAEPVAPVTTTTYTVTATDTNNCSNTATITVIVNSLPSVNAVAADGLICSGEGDTIYASGALNYSWDFGGSNSVEVIAPPLTTSYTVTGTDTNGCSDTASLTIVVSALPAIAITGDTVVCAGSNATLTATGATAYLWSSGGTGSVEIVSPAFTTGYSVTGTDTNGCSDTSSFVVTVNALPFATLDLSAVDTQCVSTASIPLNGGLPLGGAYSGTAITGNSFSPASAGPGMFGINYIYTDTNGCSASAFDSVYVDVCTGILEGWNNRIDIYPNPATDQVSIAFLAKPGELYNVELADQLGQIVYQHGYSTFVPGDLNIIINITPFAEGIYLLSVRTSTGVVSQRIIISR